MCWKCDNPNATTADYFDLIRRTIDTDGWFVQGVEKDRWRPGYAYTVGLTELGRPELVVTGMSYPQGAQFLNSVAHHLVAHGGAPLAIGGQQRWTDGLMTEVVGVAEPTVHLVTAHGLYGAEFRAHQLVRADDRGRWPWEVGFRGRQPVLGPRAVGG